MASKTSSILHEHFYKDLTLIFNSCSNAAVIGNVELLLGVIYPDDLTNSIYSRLSNAFLIGMIIGMLFFGVIVDQLGRKTGAVATTILLVLGIAMSAAANGASPKGLFWMLIVARGVAGVGAGGEYPVSGAGAVEATDESGAYRKRRGFMFAMLADLSSDLGYVWGGLVPLLLLLCVGQREDKYEIVWRTSFALGAIPPLGIFWFRMRMAVATAYRKSSMRKQRVPYWLALKRYYRPLIGSAASWFLYNWISIPFGIFSSTIISRVNTEQSLVKSLGWGVLINCFYVPGPFLGGYLSDKIGRRQTMALGFSLQAILGFIIGGAIGPIQTVFPLFVVLYGIFLTLGEVGPGRYDESCLMHWINSNFVPSSFYKQIPQFYLANILLTVFQHGGPDRIRMLPHLYSWPDDGIDKCMQQSRRSHWHSSLHGNPQQVRQQPGQGKPSGVSYRVCLCSARCPRGLFRHP